MTEESQRSSAAEISVTSNGDLDRNPEVVFQRDSYPSVPGSQNFSESGVSTAESIPESGPYTGSASLPASPVAPIAPSSAVASRLARSFSDSQAEKGAKQAQANSGAMVLADDLKSPAMEKLDLVRKWSINTYKVLCFQLRFDDLPSPSELLSLLSSSVYQTDAAQRSWVAAPATVDVELEAQIEILRDNKRKYQHVIRLAQTLAAQLSQMMQTQKQLGDAFTDLSLKSPELHDEFGYNADTQKLLAKNGETLLGAINFFISSVNTLVDKTIEDTMLNIKQYEFARIEYDAYRTDLEELNLGPRDANTLPKIEQSQQLFQIHREKYERMRNDVSVKLKFLEENKVKVLHNQLILFHNAIAAYYAGNQQQLEQTLKQFHVKMKMPGEDSPSWLEDSAGTSASQPSALQPRNAAQISSSSPSPTAPERAPRPGEPRHRSAMMMEGQKGSSETLVRDNVHDYLGLIPPGVFHGPGCPPPAAPGRKKRRVRSFFWKPIPEEKVRGKPNIWTLAVRQQQYQIDVRSVEELFGQQEEAATGARAAAQHAATSHRVSRSRSFKESTKEEISILDSKRGMNVGIFLKQFKKSNRSIVDDIRRGEGKIYGAELLKDLLKLLPDSEEIKKLRAFKGDPDKLTLVDSFMYLLIQVPRFEVRIEAMVLREEIFPLCAVMSREIDVVRVATKELMRCEELHAILHLVLQAGNIMNAGGYAGNAVGFKLSSLLSLADTKANKPGMNLLHFVAMEAKKKDEKLLKFPEKLQDVQSAARISVENIELEFSSLYVRIKSLEEKVQEDQELQQQLEAFLQTSTQTLQELKRRRLELRKEGNALIDFFCEDKDTFKLDECFRIFQDFCIKFNKAVKVGFQPGPDEPSVFSVPSSRYLEPRPCLHLPFSQDNMDRELKEAARQRRLRELEEKRFAWSGADQGGVFGRSSSENDVEMLTKECLLDFLQQRSQSPNRPLGRSASARRHRHTVNSVADRELQGYLELFGGAENPADGSRFNSLPRSGRAVQRNTTPWISAQDDNRELGCNRQLPSPRAETEPISPLARFSSSGVNDDPCNNNNIYSALSEASALHNAFFVFQKSEHLPNPSGLMNVSVERHTLVPGPQAFELRSPNNNSNHMHFVNQGDVVLTDLDGERQSPSAGLASLDDEALGRRVDSKAWKGKADPPKHAGGFPDREKEEDSTISSTTCDTSLPLDTAASHRRPGFCIVDCTETDCSVTLDYSEVESSSLAREGRLRTDLSKHKQDPNSLSSNLESPNDQSVSTSELSAPKSVDVACMTQSPVTDEWETESCDTAEGKPSVEEEGSGTQTAHARNHPSKMSRGRVVRTLTSSESQGMRKVVPITKMARTGSSKSDGGVRGRGVTTASQRPEYAIARKGRQSQAAQTLQPASGRVEGSEGDVFEVDARAIALAQTSSENSSSVALSSKSPSDVPSFARNTVASSSRTKKEPGPLSVPSTPSRSPSFRGRQNSLKQNRPSPSGQDEQQGTNLRRVQSVKAASRSARRSETP
ncbi:unnamed protein product, partial [Tetraodon nigroviridis]